jgi:hypothetical protein
MAFIRKRQSRKRLSYQVIETYREGGKVRQRVLAKVVLGRVLIKSRLVTAT